MTTKSYKRAIHCRAVLRNSTAVSPSRAPVILENASFPIPGKERSRRPWAILINDEGGSILNPGVTNSRGILSNFEIYTWKLEAEQSIQKISSF
ncbi:hypothetical protein PUN28_008544 [Cardiocondyla obscurior]|uniref:Uncharacterized protein n=1 Tax=Cardiocondyla obscurior TaxID=286306 RepID=A0AAW2G1I7_9HYME